MLNNYMEIFLFKTLKVDILLKYSNFLLNCGFVNKKCTYINSFIESTSILEHYYSSFHNIFNVLLKSVIQVTRF